MRTRLAILCASVAMLCLCCSKVQDRPGDNPGETGGDTPGIDNSAFERTAYDTLKVMSFNILVYHAKDTGTVRWEYRKPGCIAMIRDCTPHIVGLQECSDAQFKELLEELPEYEGVSIPKAFTNFGTCIIWRKDALRRSSHGFHWYSDNPSVPSPAWPDVCDDPTYRTYIWADLRLIGSDIPVYVYDTHYPRNYTAGAPNNEARRRCSEALVRHASGRLDEEAVIFTMGDLNCSLAEAAGAASLAPLCEWMSSSRESLTDDKRDQFRSQNSFNPSAPIEGGRSSIDQIYFRNVEPLNYRTVWEPYEGVRFISDHFPILFTCRVKYKETVHGVGTASLEGFPNGGKFKF